MTSAVATMRRVNAAASRANATGYGQYATGFCDHTRGAACCRRVIARFNPKNKNKPKQLHNNIYMRGKLKLIYI